LKRLQNFKESLAEVLFIIKACLTTLWFWVPVLYAVYFFFQMWIFLVHPITIFILPLILSVYAVWLDERRKNYKVRFSEIKYLSASHPLGAGPEMKPFKAEVESMVKEYEKLLQKKPRKQKDS